MVRPGLQWLDGAENNKGIPVFRHADGRLFQSRTLMASRVPISAKRGRNRAQSPDPVDQTRRQHLPTDMMMENSIFRRSKVGVGSSSAKLSRLQRAHLILEQNRIVAGGLSSSYGLIPFVSNCEAANPVRMRCARAGAFFDGNIRPCGHTRPV